LGYTLARVTLAVVLLVAATSKAMVLGVPGNAPASAVLRLLAVLELCVEWFMAAWLLSGVAPVWARRAAMSLLLLFVAVIAWRLAAGERDCHCFGALRVPPMVTLAFDLITLAALYGFGRGALEPRPQRDPDAGATAGQPFLSLRLSFAVMAATVVPTSVVVAERKLPALGAAFGRAVPLDPQSWPGRRLPLLEYVESRDRADLITGEHTLIFVSRDCDTCKRYLAKRAEALASDPGAAGAVRLIDLASVTEPGDLSTPFAQVHLNRPVALLAAVPLEVTLQNGIVAAVRHPE
jgi:hypothetical protein